MKKLFISKLPWALFFSVAGLATACNDNDGSAVVQKLDLENHSVNPALAKTLPGFDHVKISTLISSEDKLSQSPDFVYGAQPDGAALLPDPASSGYVMNGYAGRPGLRRGVCPL
jgi:hypothetical protein